METPACFVGIDVAKARLDIAVRPGGEQWTARPYMDGQIIEPGTQVEVVEIKGATALVYE